MLRRRWRRRRSTACSSWSIASSLASSRRTTCSTRSRGAYVSDFTHRELRLVGKRVFRLGLAANFGIDEAGIERAFERGINYVYVTSRGQLARPLRAALKRDREKLVVASGPLVGYFGGSVRRSA